MKKILGLLIIFLFVPTLTGAIDFDNPLSYDTFTEFVGHFGNWMFTLALAIVPVAVIVGAFFILSAGGVPDNMKKGKDIILYAVIGLAILLFARGIASIVLHLFS